VLKNIITETSQSHKLPIRLTVLEF